MLADGSEVGHFAHIGGEAALEARSSVVDGLGMAGHEAATVSGRCGVATRTLAGGSGSNGGVAGSEFVEAAREGVIVGHDALIHSKYGQWRRSG